MKKIKKLGLILFLALGIFSVAYPTINASAMHTADVVAYEDVRNSGSPYYYTHVVNTSYTTIYFANGYRKIADGSKDITPWNYPGDETLIRYYYRYETY